MLFFAGWREGTALVGERFFALPVGERFFGAETRTDFGFCGDPLSGEARAVAGEFATGLAATALPLPLADTGVRFVADVAARADALLAGGVFFCADDPAPADVLRGGVFFFGADAGDAVAVFFDCLACACFFLFLGTGFASAKAFLCGSALTAVPLPTP